MLSINENEILCKQPKFLFVLQQLVAFDVGLMENVILNMQAKEEEEAATEEEDGEEEGVVKDGDGQLNPMKLTAGKRKTQHLFHSAFKTCNM